MSSLYEISGKILLLQQMMEEEELDPQVIADTMEMIDGEYEMKMESYSKVVKNLEADCEAIDNEIKRFNARKKSLKANIDRLKNAMYESLKATGKNKVKGVLFTVAIQKNGGVLPVVYDKDNKDITLDLPDELVNVVETPDLNAIREKLEAGEKVEGFSLGERGESLRIK